MVKRCFAFLLTVAVLICALAVPIAAEETESDGGLKYATGDFEPREDISIVTHGLGYVPDILIISTDKLPVAGKIFLAIGFSQRALDMLGSNAYSTLYANMQGASFTVRTQTGMENVTIPNAEMYGFIRAVDEETFTIGGSTFALDTTSATWGDDVKGSYSWTAISGLSASESGALSYATGDFDSYEDISTVTHDLGYVPDILIVSTDKLPVEGKIFLAIGFSQRVLDMLGESAYGTVYANMSGGSFTMRTQTGMEYATMANGETYGFIRGVDEETFTIGGSTFALDTTSAAWGDDVKGSYSWTAISGLSGTAAHTHEYDSVVVSPTCTLEGYTAHTCTICGKRYTDSAVPATGHAWSDPVLVEPTCTEEGRETMTCTTCGEEQVETLPAVGHDFQNGICAICGAVDPDASGPGATDPDTSTSSSGEVVEPDPSESSSSSVDPDPSESDSSGSIDPDPSESSSGDSAGSDPSESSSSSEVPDPSETDPTTPGGTLVPGGAHSAPIKAEEDSAVVLAIKFIAVICLPIVVYLALEPNDVRKRRRRRR